MKRNILKEQFGIKEHQNGYGVTSLCGAHTYAIVTNEGVAHIYPEAENLPTWHGTFLKNNLLGTNIFLKGFTL